MAKRVMEDMKSGGIKITRIVNIKKEVPEPSSYKKEVPEPSSYKKEQPISYKKNKNKNEFTRRFSSTPHSPKSKTNLHRFFVILLLIAILIAGVYWISDAFQNARIYITSKNKSFVLDHQQFVASNDSSTPTNFELMIVSSEEDKDVTLSSSLQNVSYKAKGEITLYNEYSTKPQSLSAHTFISDDNGKTYQTDSSVTIPGYTLDNNKNITAGQASVGITSFLPGDSYNGSPNSFTINSFKNTAKFKAIYGKLKTALTGGAQGNVYTLDPVEKGTMDAIAQSSFKSNLINKAIAEVPSDYILYPNAYTFSYQIDENIFSPTPNAKVKITGSLSAIILDKKDLSNTLVKNMLPDVVNPELSEISIQNLSKLNFNFIQQDQSITKDTKSIPFSLSGTLNAKWSPNISNLIDKLQGVNKNNLTSIFKLDPGIDSVETKIFPPWQSYLPNDKSKIHIYVE
ncbi:MAG: hypothetical protein KGI58_02970 [Patescibacteria group bacterium]|nr:hypothetical protein [Patescibacteria group bacterium]